MAAVSYSLEKAAQFNSAKVNNAWKPAATDDADTSARVAIQGLVS